MLRRVACPILPCLILLSLGGLADGAAREDLPLADFEGMGWGDWTVRGEAFGAGPSPRQLAGREGQSVASSFNFGGDASTGALISPPFSIQRDYLNFRIGGGGFRDRTCLHLRVAGHIVREATGPQVQPDGAVEVLEPRHWDVRDLAGQTAVLEIVDRSTGWWGHVDVDAIVQSDRPTGVRSDVRLPLVVQHRYLNLPVKDGAAKQWVNVEVDGQVARRFSIALADDQPDWWAFLDLKPFAGKTFTLRVDRLPGTSHALENLEQADTLRGSEPLYQERLRPQFHFSSRRGWNNDVNGLVYYQGEYHLFYQLNPYGVDFGNLHWGHAVSRDLVHWSELDIALYPDDLGLVFSGSAVVDGSNTLGVARGEEKPLVAVFTSSGERCVQSLAYSTDRGRTWIKFDQNPIVPELQIANRDPKVFWYEPDKTWVMALFAGVPRKPNPQCPDDIENTAHFLRSSNLRDWTLMSRQADVLECPDLFELPLEEDASQKRWVLTEADSDYQVGRFDGTRFTPETPKLPGHQGQGFYGVQTYNDIPASDGRRIQLGCFVAPSPGMPFNDAVTLPQALSLCSTPEGPRLVRQPVRELESLRKASWPVPPTTLVPGGKNPLAELQAELVELRAEFDPGTANTVTFRVRGATIVYDAPKHEWIVNDHHAPAPGGEGRQDLIVYCDRTTLEIFASRGRTFIPMPFLPEADDQSLVVTVEGGQAQLQSMTVYPLRSIWE